MTLKLARNMVGYVMMRAVHEALVLTRAGDIDAATLRHVLVESDLPMQYLAPIGFGGPTPVGTDAPAEQRSFLEHTCRLGDKDLDEALAVAARLGVGLEVAALTRQHFHEVLRLREPPS
jgi:3-hydroxyisobutyrate dehydrogenase-like beta-hydroxyacid dehydrogenase